MTSWHAGCPVPVSDLRIVSVTYWGFDRTSHRGELMLNEDAVRPVVDALRFLYARRFPIRSMRLVEAYGSSDDRSMAADNTSAFNCRIVPGSTVWSQHAYGRAIDINPVENPEVKDGIFSPPEGTAFGDRSRDGRGVILAGGMAVRAFQSVGWGWGGSWQSLKDYQHFSATGT
jgi:hypothetical protein